MKFRLVQSLTLASTSPRRLSLLRQAGIQPLVISKSYGEELEAAASPRELAEINAKRKFEAARPHVKGCFLSADTVVGLDDETLGKPDSPAHAKEMLAKLSGCVHSVVTAYCIGFSSETTPRIRRAVSSAVRF